MTRTIQIRNVPDPVHCRLKALAAEAGMSLSEFLLRQIAQLVEGPTLDEINARARLRQPASGVDSAAEVRAERGARA